MADDDFDDGIFDDDLSSEVTTGDDGGAQGQETETEISRAVVEAFRQRGAELPDDFDDEKLFANLAQMNQRLREMPDPMELAELREIRSRYRQERDGLKPTETVEKPADTKPAQKVSRLEYPSEAEQYTQWDDKTGMYVPKSQAFPNIAAVEAMNKWHQQSEANKKRLLADPLGYIYENGLNDKFAEFEKSIEQKILERLQTEQQQKTTEAQVIQFWTDNGGKLFEQAKNGDYKRDLQGNEIPTEQGRYYLKKLESLKQAGFEGQGAIEFAFHESEAWAKRRASRQKTAEETSESGAGTSANDLKKSFVQQGRAADESSRRNGKQRVVDRAASVVNAAESGLPQNGGEGFSAMANRYAKSKGLV